MVYLKKDGVQERRGGGGGGGTDGIKEGKAKRKEWKKVEGLVEGLEKEEGTG
jgi:hypothetical protein